MIGLMRAALLAAAISGAWSPTFSPVWSPSMGKPGRHVPGLIGDCGASLAAISGTLITCADFIHGGYYANGAAYASFGAAGGVGSGCGLSSSGVTCTGTANNSIAAGNPASNYVMIVKASNTNASGTAMNAFLQTSTSAALSDYETGGTRAIRNGGGAGSQSTGLSGEDAFCEGPSVWFGAPLGVTPGGSQPVSSNSPGANATLYVGNANGSFPNGSGAYIQSIRIIAVPSCSAAVVTTAATL